MSITLKDNTNYKMYDLVESFQIDSQSFASIIPFFINTIIVSPIRDCFIVWTISVWYSMCTPWICIHINGIANIPWTPVTIIPDGIFTITSFIPSIATLLVILSIVICMIRTLCLMRSFVTLFTANPDLIAGASCNKIKF